MRTKIVILLILISAALRAQTISNLDSLELSEGGINPRSIRIGQTGYFACIYYVTGNMVLHTFSVDLSDGSIGSVVDTQTLTSEMHEYQPALCQVESSEYYAVAWRDGNDDGWVATIEIDTTNGNIVTTTQKTDSLKFEADNSMAQPSIYHAGGHHYLIVYVKSTGTGAGELQGPVWAKTVQIDDADGSITQSVTDALQLTSDDGRFPIACSVGNDYWAAADQPGDIWTFTVNSSTGAISNSVSDTESFRSDGASPGKPEMVHAGSGDKFLIAYEYKTSDPHTVKLKTFTINSSTGDISSKIDSVTVSADGEDPGLCRVSDSDYYAVNYNEESDGGKNGVVKTYTVNGTTGDIGSSAEDSYEYDSDYCNDPVIFQAGDTPAYLVTYMDTGSDPWVRTLQITGGSAEYESGATGYGSKVYSIVPKAVNGVHSIKAINGVR